MSQFGKIFNRNNLVDKLQKPFSSIKFNKSRIAVLSWTDIFIFFGSLFIGRNDSFVGVLGMASALWAALSIMKYSYQFPIFLGITIGLGSTGDTRGILCFWSFCVAFMVIKKLKFRNKTISKGISILLSATIAYLIRVMGDAHVIHMPIYILSTLFLTQIFYVALNDKVLKITKYSNDDWRLLSRLIVVSAAISGVGPIAIGSLSVVNIVKHLSIMIIALTGSYSAALAGIIIGSGLLSGTFYPILAGQACFTGFILGISKAYSKLAFIIVALVSNIIWLWQDSLTDIKIALIELAIAIILWGIIQRVLPEKSLALDIGKNTPLVIGDTQKPVDESWVQIAEVCDEIAVVLSASEYQPIENTHLLQIIEWTGISLCEKCPHYDQCWSEELFLTYHRWKDFLTDMDNVSEEASNSIAQVLPKHCPYKDKLASVFNEHLNLIRVELFWRNKLQECSSLAIDRLSDFSDMARALAFGTNQQKELEKDLINKIKVEISKQGIKLSKIDLACTNSKRVLKLGMGSCYDYKACSDIIIPIVNRVIGGKLINSLYNCSKHTKSLSCSCKLEYAPKVSVEFGVASMASEGVSGDSYWLDHLTDGRCIALLSDGMGSGVAARKDSEYAIDLLQKLLKTGLDIKSLIKLLNTALALGIQQDSFVTMDGVLVDCFNSGAQLIKIGASYTCLKRERNVKLWKSSTLPVGVFPEVDIDQFDLNLIKGDVIIMLSDGIVDNQREVVDSEKWLVNIIREMPKIEPQEIAEYIIKVAKRHSNASIKDDMTAIVLKIN